MQNARSQILHESPGSLAMHSRCARHLPQDRVWQLGSTPYDDVGVTALKCGRLWAFCRLEMPQNAGFQHGIQLSDFFGRRFMARSS